MGGNRYISSEFNRMSLKLRSNPKVAVVAICVSLGSECSNLELPPAFCNDKQFVLQLGKVLTKSYWPKRKFLLQFASPALQKDWVVLLLPTQPRLKSF
jgi:hypothetical protein